MSPASTPVQPSLLRTSSTAALVLVAVLLAWPSLSIWGAWLGVDAQHTQLIAHMVQTVLPDYAWASLLLCLGVGVLVALLGSATAALVCLFNFPGKRWLEWALLLPMAMPAYVVAYAYTDFLQFSGPLQTALRQATGWQGALWPDVRSLWGAVLVFTLTLYPYVYLLVKTALREQASRLMEAARLLGASKTRRIMTIALPMARPAIAAGVALALMETLADFGVSSYFGIQSFTAGIYKAWLSMDAPLVAGQLASVLLVVVLVLLQVEKHAQSKQRFYSNRSSASNLSGPPLTKTSKGWVLLALGCIPVLLGFVLPSAILLWRWLSDPQVASWQQYLQWGWNSLRLAGITALLAVALALLIGARNRLLPTPLTRLLARLIQLGYAIPGAVVVVGILLPLSLTHAISAMQPLTALLTTTGVALVWAYLVRFTAVAMQSVDSAYTRIPLSLDEASRTLGVQGWALWRGVHLPLLRTNVVAAVLLVFVDVMKELPATLVLRPFNSDTLAVVAYQLARDERLGEAAIPSLALVAFGLIPVLLLNRQHRHDK
ncbi:iron ABC transporter permease [Limnohabitans sp.]|uniref:ABC transporter permease n=1 Tax=Limnohabitans sp. TaxID=1907725 RepID=UPI00311E35FA